jgi:hypothetical protein
VREADTQDDLSRIYTAFAWLGMSTLSSDGATALDAMKGIVKKRGGTNVVVLDTRFQYGFLRLLLSVSGESI